MHENDPHRNGSEEMFFIYHLLHEKKKLLKGHKYECLSNSSLRVKIVFASARKTISVLNKMFI